MARKKDGDKGADKGQGVELKLVDSGSGIVPHDGQEPFADIRSQVLELKKRVDQGRWGLAEAFHKIYDESIYSRWGYADFSDYLEFEVGMTERTAKYLIAVYKWFAIEMAGKMSSKEKRKEMLDSVKSVGWTKAKYLISVTKPENVMEWIERAKKLKSAELQIETKKALLEEAGGDPGDISDSKGFHFTCVGDQIETVSRALDKAKEIAETKKKGHALSLLCQDFLASHPDKDMGKAKNMGKFMDQIGARFGALLVVVDKDTGKVVHGKEILSKLEKKK